MCPRESAAKSRINILVAWKAILDGFRIGESLMTGFRGLHETFEVMVIPGQQS